MSHQTWGGRFKKPLNSLVNQFNASFAFDKVLYTYDIAGSIVHAKMLAKQKLISAREAESIVAGLEAIKAALDVHEPILDVSAEDIHMAIEQALIAKIGDAGKKLHTGRSRNDQVALDLRLYTRAAYEQIQTLLENLLATLAVLMQQHAQDSMPGYTHLQPAQPILLGDYFGAYHAMFSRDLSRLQDGYKRMNVCPLGAGALAGSRLPLDREWVAEQLGFSGVITNTLDAVSDRDFILELMNTASLIMMHLSRLCEDLIIWATEEFGFIRLDDAFATGSSLMPNKKNPDVLELIRGKTGRVFGHLFALFTVLKGLPLAYNKDMQEDKEGLFDTVHTVSACLEILSPFLKSLSFNTVLMQSRAESGFLSATAYLEALVLKGVPFREAHHRIGILVGQAIEKGVSLQELIEQGNES